MHIKATIVAYAFSVQCLEDATVVAYAGLRVNQDYDKQVTSRQCKVDKKGTYHCNQLLHTYILTV